MAILDPGTRLSVPEMGAAIGSRTGAGLCWHRAAIGSRTAPKGGSVPEPPLPILLLQYFGDNWQYGNRAIVSCITLFSSFMNRCDQRVFPVFWVMFAPYREIEYVG